MVTSQLPEDLVYAYAPRNEETLHIGTTASDFVKQFGLLLRFSGHAFFGPGGEDAPVYSVVPGDPPEADGLPGVWQMYARLLRPPPAAPSTDSADNNCKCESRGLDPDHYLNIGAISIDPDPPKVTRVTVTCWEPVAWRFYVWSLRSIRSLWPDSTADKLTGGRFEVEEEARPGLTADQVAQVLTTVLTGLDHEVDGRLAHDFAAHGLEGYEYEYQQAPAGNHTFTLKLGGKPWGRIQVGPDGTTASPQPFDQEETTDPQWAALYGTICNRLSLALTGQVDPETIEAERDAWDRLRTATADGPDAAPSPRPGGRVERVEMQTVPKLRGRKPDPGYDWAYGKIRGGSKFGDVYREWRKKLPEDRKAELDDPYEAFKKAMKRRRRKEPQGDEMPKGDDIQARV